MDDVITHIKRYSSMCGFIHASGHPVVNFFATHFPFQLKVVKIFTRFLYNFLHSTLKDILKKIENTKNTTQNCLMRNRLPLGLLFVSSFFPFVLDNIVVSVWFHCYIQTHTLCSVLKC